MILALFMHVNKNDDDAGGQAGDCVTVYTFASCQGCNDIHVSLKCVADVCGGSMLALTWGNGTGAP